MENYYVISYDDNSYFDGMFLYEKPARFIKEKYNAKFYKFYFDAHDAYLKIINDGPYGAFKGRLRIEILKHSPVEEVTLPKIPEIDESYVIYHKDKGYAYNYCKIWLFTSSIHKAEFFEKAADTHHVIEILKEGCEVRKVIICLD